MQALVASREERRLAVPLVATLFCLSASATALARPPEILPRSELTAGMPLVGRTVFRGEQVDTFRLECLGVLEGGAAGGDLILARALDERVRESGIAAGMSGSPITSADGRLVGALAYSWSFSREPICGITPIEEMLPLLEERGRLGGDALPEAPGRREGSGWGTLRTPISVSGLPESAVRWFEAEVQGRGWMVAPGGARPAAPPPAARPLLPGEAVAVELLRGDASVAAVGTVTWVDGDRLLAFGHPFLFGGTSALPLSRAAIVAVVPRWQSSMKLGMPTAPIGTLIEDRRAGVAGVLGEGPSLVPFTVRVRPREAWREFHYEMVRERALTPTLAFLAASASLLADGALPPEAAWRWRLRARFHASGEPSRILDLGDRASTPGDTPFASALLDPLRALLDNTWARVELDSLHWEVAVTDEERYALLVAARLSAPRARPGERVRVEVELQRARGERERRFLELDVPASTPEGEYAVFVGGGQEWEKQEARLQPARLTPTSLEALVRSLAEAPRAAELRAVLVGSIRSFVTGGRDYPEPPPSAARLLAPAERGGTATRWVGAAPMAEARLATEWPIEGSASLRLRVERHEP